MRVSVPIIVVYGTNAKKIKGLRKLNVFFISYSTIIVKVLENYPIKSVTHAADLKKMFPDIDI